MSNQSRIEWTEATWNPTTGCTKVSPGCKNCYAERMSKRLKGMGIEKYSSGFKLAIHHGLLEIPLSWATPKIIFVNSMSDLFHEDIPFDFIEAVFDVMVKSNWHTFQVLTKRSERLKELHKLLNWSPNIWMGVSVECEEYLYRIDDLRRTGAKVKFLSLEPLLGPLPRLDLSMIDWVIVGGESGPRSRPLKEDWVLKIRDQCLENDVRFFFKQWGGFNKKKNGRSLEGRTWNQIPDALKLNEPIVVYS